MTCCTQHLTGKYVLSPIDHQTYCRKNGQFLRHLRANGFEGYQDFFETYFPERAVKCSCGKPCNFIPSKMEYMQTCGNKSCANSASSSTKQNFTNKQRSEQRAKYHNTMNQKSDQDLLASNLKRKQTNLARYGYDHPWKAPAVRQKIATTMQDRFSVPNFSNTLISTTVKELLNDKDWLYQQHVIKQKPLYVIANELQIGDRTVGNYLHKHGIHTHSFQQSQWENELGNFLSSINVDFVTNARDVIPPKELDFFIPQTNVAIELCGLYWHSESQERITKHYHENKRKACAEQNIQLLTIFEDEWQKKDIIFSKLCHVFNKTTEKTLIRHTTVDLSVPKTERKEFLNQTHIQGNGRGRISIGLRNRNNQLIALGLFSISRKYQGVVLDRFSTCVLVPGALGKILKELERNFNINRVVTFADLRWSTGSLYHKLGFEQDCVIPPDYAYVVQNQRIHKFNFRHANLRNKLTNYDPLLSERDNCVNNGLYRVWDCGKIRFIKKS